MPSEFQIWFFQLIHYFMIAMKCEKRRFIQLSYAFIYKLAKKTFKHPTIQNWKVYRPRIERIRHFFSSARQYFQLKLFQMSNMLSKRPVEWKSCVYRTLRRVNKCQTAVAVPAICRFGHNGRKTVSYFRKSSASIWRPQELVHARRFVSSDFGKILKNWRTFVNYNSGTTPHYPIRNRSIGFKRNVTRSVDNFWLFGIWWFSYPSSFSDHRS